MGNALETLQGAHHDENERYCSVHAALGNHHEEGRLELYASVLLLKKILLQECEVRK
jgi:hypothetical protein